MRTFIAIDFPKEILEKISRIITFLQSQTTEKALKWVETDIMHLTLKFIGEISEDAARDVQTIMRHTLQGQNAFEVSIEGLGMYPNPKNPRVVWLGISAEKALFDIQKNLDLALQKINIPSEKRGFSPHLTIARLRKSTDVKTIRLIGETLSQFKVDSLGTVLIKEIRLYQSQLTPTGPIYTPLLKIPLNQV